MRVLAHALRCAVALVCVAGSQLVYVGCSGGFVATPDGSVAPPGVEAGSDARLDVVEAGPDAPLVEAGPAEGDPRLDRAPQVTCYTPLDPSAVPGTFPGYAFDLFKGQRADGLPIASASGSLFHCASSGLTKMLLSYEAPAATSRPSFGIKREGVGTAFVVDYVLESSAVPQETTDDILVGPFAVSSSPSALLVLAIARRAPSEVLEVVRVTSTDTAAIDLGIFTYPVHLRLETVAVGTNGVAWTVTARDRATRTVRKGTETKPDAPFSLLFGTTRTAPSAPNTAVFSDVKLP
jgi:hypothetical protein